MADNHLVALLDPRNSIVYKLVHNSLGGLPLVDNSSTLAHEHGSKLVHNLVKINLTLLIVSDLEALGRRGHLASHELVEVGLVRDLALGCELPDLSLSLGLPVFNVGVGLDAHGSAGEDDGPDVGVEIGSLDTLLVRLGGTSLVCEDEACANPDSGSAHHERGSKKLSVVDTTGGNDLDGSTSHGGLVALDEVDNGGDKHGCGGVAGVATALTTLGADNVDTEVEALLDVLGVTDHVHVEDAGFVELLDNVLGRDTDGGNKKGSARLDDNVDELVKLALGVIVAVELPWLAQVVANAPLE